MPESLDQPLLRRKTDKVETAQAPIRSAAQLINTRVTIVFIGILIVCVMVEVILIILALAALRTLKVWETLDPRTYAIITCGTAIIGFASLVYYIVAYLRSSNT